MQYLLDKFEGELREMIKYSSRRSVSEDLEENHKIGFNFAGRNIKILARKFDKLN